VEVGSLNYEIDSLTFLRGIQVAIFVDFLNAVFRLAAMGFWGPNILTVYFSLIEFLFLVVLWTLQPNGNIVRIFSALGIFLMSWVEYLWIIGYLVFEFETLSIFWMLIIFLTLRLMFLGRIGYNLYTRDQEMTSHDQDIQIA